MLQKANFIFTNEAEYQALKQLGTIDFDKPIVLKQGKAGATYFYHGETITIPAPQVEVVELLALEMCSREHS
ncbi:MAG: hypothetical protein ACD_46C00286G0004 [uncultured bacterium]|nr:MAG: hypothetical protein ACD_46C00286G0004 [uncultured bacterium]